MNEPLPRSELIRKVTTMPPAEVRYTDRTPTDQFLRAPLPGVALTREAVERIQNSLIN